MKRSRRIVLVCHCILNSNSKVEGLAEYQGALTDTVKLLMEEGLGIMQLPCPEISSCGMRRWGMVKEQYDTPFYRDHCQRLFYPQLQQVEEYLLNGYEIVGIIGIDGSPSCGVNKTCSGDWKGEISKNPDIQNMINGLQMVEGSGVFIEEIKEMLKKRDIHISFSAVDEASPIDSYKEIQKFIRGKKHNENE